MIKLDLKREAHWLDLVKGVRVKVHPITTALVLAARRAAEQLDVPAGPEGEGRKLSAFLTQLAQIAVIEWEGVGDDAGNPAPVTPEAVAALLDIPRVAEAFQLKYFLPTLILDSAGNG